jgi:hypothetical protein
VKDEATRLTAGKSSRVGRLRAYALIAATFVVFVMLVGCGAVYPPPVVDFDATEVYPGATEVVTHEMQVAWRTQDIEQYRTVGFHTGDSPDVVLNYFRKTLLDRGWAISGCQGADGSLTFVWVHPYNSAMEIFEVAADSTNQGNIELRFARHLYGPIGSMYYDIEKVVAEDEVVQECLGVYNGDSDARIAAGVVGSIFVGLVMLVHILLSAWVWRGYSFVSLWGFIVVGIMTTLLWGGFLGAAEIAIWMKKPSYVQPPDVNVTRTGDLYRLIIESPVQYAILLVGITWTGILLKAPLEDALRSWRMRRAGSKKP